MKRFILLSLSFILIGGVCAQGFPQAQKQPRPKEMKKKRKHYKRQGKRRHHKMRTEQHQQELWQATAYTPAVYPFTPVYLPIVTERRLTTPVNVTA